MNSMNGLHALNPWNNPRLGDFLRRSAEQGHSAEAVNAFAMVGNAATVPAALPWMGALGALGGAIIAAASLLTNVVSAQTGLQTGFQTLACAFRHHLWRIASAWSGGLTVTGRAPRTGGRILVANHSSHADTAALLAALPPTAQPVFAAASDYWFDVPVRRFVITALAGGLPVRRTEGGCYEALLAAVKPALARGRTVVIFPEGTRSTDGKVGEFRSGALHLARDCGVPIVPVALLGTGDVLPKGGHYSPAPMEVRFGQPIDPATIDASQLRDEVVAIRDEQPVRVRRSNVWTAITRMVIARHGRPALADVHSLPANRPQATADHRPATLAA